MATEYPHLERAPITEALLDIRVEPKEGLGLDALEPISLLVAERYPVRKTLRMSQVEFPVPNSHAPQEVQARHLETGFIYWNSDNSRAIQARIDGFTVNHVNRYNNWASLQGDAQELWPAYVAQTEPRKVTRLGLRYINRIEVPYGIDLSQVFQTRIEVGPKLPQLHEELLMRICIPFGECKAAITISTAPPSHEPFALVILDIDVFTNVTSAPSGKPIWQAFEELHTIKNQCFFESLQPEAWKNCQ